MRIAALGDIHSNHIALEACMEYIFKNRIDGVAFQGDYVSDFPYPQRTMRILKNIPDELAAWFIRGNREDYMLKHSREHTERWSYNSQSGSLLYTYENLSGSDLRFFEAMPVGMVVKPDGFPPFSICHGSMDNNRDLFFGDCPKTREVMAEMTTDLLVCGHCHQPYIFTDGKKTIANTGAVSGNFSDGHTSARFVVLESDGGEWSVSPVSVPFDIEAAEKEFYSSGLFYKANVWSRCTIATMKNGRNYNDECVKLVLNMCEELGKPFDCEELWQRAAEMLGI